MWHIALDMQHQYHSELIEQANNARLAKLAAAAPRRSWSGWINWNWLKTQPAPAQPVYAAVPACCTA